MGCCLTTIFLVLISRIAILLWWLADSQHFTLAFNNMVFPAWFWTLAGGIFLPWTTLAYLLVFQGGIGEYKWIVLGVAFLIDLAGHGGTAHHSHRFGLL
jgi:hypothetical protein